MNLTVKNGSFSYNRGKTTVFQNINFSVDAGEILAILGPNGAGKTTLLRCITGMLRWSGGESLLDGEAIRKMPPRKLWSRMAYVPQAKAASAAYTAFETVLLGRSSRLNAFETPGDADVQKCCACHFAEEDNQRYAESKGGDKRVHHCEYRVSAGVKVAVHNEYKAQSYLVKCV